MADCAIHAKVSRKLGVHLITKSLLLIFTDLDGCLLNKSDYQYEAARPTLARIAEANIPLVLCSSKTKAEMQPLAEKLDLSWPFVCENGGVIVWNDGRADSILGNSRSTVLEVLQSVRSQFKFRTFDDLGVEGLIQVADLEAVSAQRAIARQCTEPLLWDDSADKIDRFRQSLLEADLYLTQGGRFWHVAGPVSKGDGVRAVTDQFRQSAGLPVTTVAIGDSPIDRPMLEFADIAVLIPQPDGSFLISVNNQRHVLANQSGSAGWADELGRLLDELAY